MLCDYAANFRQFYLLLWKNFILQVRPSGKIQFPFVNMLNNFFTGTAPNRLSIRVDYPNHSFVADNSSEVSPCVKLVTADACTGAHSAT